MGLSLVILPLILVVAPLNGEWMLVSNRFIYPDGWSHSFDFMYGSFQILDKQLYIPFYLCLALAALV